MYFRSSTLTVFCFLLSFTIGKSQVLNQAKLFDLLPAIPANLSSATYEEESAFRAKSDSIYNLLVDYEEKYKRTRSSDDETNSEKIMEYYDIRDRIMDLHSIQRNKYYDLFPLYSDIDSELAEKNSLLQESLEQAKYSSNNNSNAVSGIEEQIYANKIECSEKKIAIFLQFLKEYRAELDAIAEMANKSEEIPLPDHLNKNTSYVLLNVKSYMNYLSEAYQFNVGPFGDTNRAE